MFSALFRWPEKLCLSCFIIWIKDSTFSWSVWAASSPASLFWFLSPMSPPDIGTTVGVVSIFCQVKVEFYFYLPTWEWSCEHSQHVSAEKAGEIFRMSHRTHLRLSLNIYRERVLEVYWDWGTSEDQKMIFHGNLFFWLRYVESYGEHSGIISQERQKVLSE